MDSKYNYCKKLNTFQILDKNFRPAITEYKRFNEKVLKTGNSIPIEIALERNDGLISKYKTNIFNDVMNMDKVNYFYIERLIKTLLWSRGGWKITIGGSFKIGEYIKKTYALGGLREFDAKFMERVYSKPFTIISTDINNVPELNEKTRPLGRHLNGCRIGFDAGGSDHKISAMIDGKVIFNEELVWHPKLHSNPEYHYNEILKALKKAASKLPRVDAIGVSTPGIYINNRVIVASIFIKVPDKIFNEKVKNIFINIQKAMGGVPLEVANDGDVAALAGAMYIVNDINILGISMGTSEAGGYIDGMGNITGWINELAFIPIDFNSNAMIDEWSGDIGCGGKYFSQDAVINLARLAGITLNESLTSAKKLEVIQTLHANGDNRAKNIFHTIGYYLGYTIAYYAQIYNFKHILILGRVTTGEGGNTILNEARYILNTEFTDLAKNIKLHLPNESNKRFAQSIAAASLPMIDH